MKKSNYGQYAIDFYLDWFNNYLTVSKIAEDYGFSESSANRLINRGRKLHLSLHAQ